MSVVRTAMRTTPVPVTVGTFEVRGKHDGLNVTTVGRIGFGTSS